MSELIVVDFPAAPRRVFRDPAEVLRADHIDDVRGVLARAEQSARAGCFVVGYVAYEAAPAFDRALVVRSGGRMPLAWFAVFDHADHELNLTDASAEIAELSAPDRDTYLRGVARIREEIAAGNTYQANLTARFEAKLHGNPFALYQSLTRAQGAGYHAYIDTGDFIIASASPELFFELRDRRIRTRPMKGTRKRGRFTAEDEILAQELAASQKDRAENLMIVDLLRNDVGRIARAGTVQVPTLFAIERYRTVHQLTSTIEAELRDDVNLVDVFAALFPCGSVTGAPKVSTMKLIAELEGAPREVYCGAVGIIEPGGACTFNVPIRTLWLERAGGPAVYSSGAGITYESDAAEEYREVVAKAAILTESWPDFELLETMRLERGEVVRLERHLARLADSARYFGFVYDEVAIRAALSDVRAEHGRVRLRVAPDGTPRVAVSRLDTPASANVAFAAHAVDSTARFLFHKTTNRGVYERAAQARPEVWDVLLCNERAEVTEFTRGNVIVELDGRLLTPARTCGLLAGCYRAELLESGEIEEAVITRSDLARATGIWFINSLRGQIAVTLIG